MRSFFIFLAATFAYFGMLDVAGISTTAAFLLAIALLSALHALKPEEK